MTSSSYCKLTLVRSRHAARIQSSTLTLFVRSYLPNYFVMFTKKTCYSKQCNFCRVVKYTYSTEFVLAEPQIERSPENILHKYLPASYSIDVAQQNNFCVIAISSLFA